MTQLLDDPAPWQALGRVESLQRETCLVRQVVLARCRIRLADFQPDWPILKFSSFSDAIAADRASASRPNSVGVRPISALSRMPSWAEFVPCSAVTFQHALRKHDEVLNGALSSILCVGGGTYAVISGSAADDLWMHLVCLPLSPALGALGGYLRSRQAARIA